MSTDSDNLDMSPFPPMTWDDCDWWDGSIELSFGYAGLTVTPYDPSVSRLPESYQREALSFLLEQGDIVYRSALAALKPYYEEMRPKYRSFLGTRFDSLMPVLTTATDLTPLIDLRQVHIHPWSKDGVGYIGLQFGCTWDQEHGLGIMMHRDRVVEIGGADVSFAWAPEEADNAS